MELTSLSSGLLGALLGALVGFGSSWFLDRRRRILDERAACRVVSMEMARNIGHLQRFQPVDITVPALTTRAWLASAHLLSRGLDRTAFSALAAFYTLVGEMLDVEPRIAGNPDATTAYRALAVAEALQFANDAFESLVVAADWTAETRKRLLLTGPAPANGTHETGADVAIGAVSLDALKRRLPADVGRTVASAGSIEELVDRLAGRVQTLEDPKVLTDKVEREMRDRELRGPVTKRR